MGTTGLMMPFALYLLLLPHLCLLRRLRSCWLDLGWSSSLFSWGSHAWLWFLFLSCVSMYGFLSILIILISFCDVIEDLPNCISGYSHVVRMATWSIF